MSFFCRFFVDFCRKGANLNAQRYDKATSLIIAAARGYVSILKLLLSNGADPNLAQQDGATAAYVAVGKRKVRD